MSPVSVWRAKLGPAAFWIAAGLAVLGFWTMVGKAMIDTGVHKGTLEAAAELSRQALASAEAADARAARRDSMVFGHLPSQLPARLEMHTVDGRWLALDWSGDSLVYQGDIPAAEGAKLFLYWVQEVALRQRNPLIFPEQADGSP